MVTLQLRHPDTRKLMKVRLPETVDVLKLLNNDNAKGIISFCFGLPKQEIIDRIERDGEIDLPDHEELKFSPSYEKAKKAIQRLIILCNPELRGEWCIVVKQ